jgi:hypothetical protein
MLALNLERLYIVIETFLASFGVKNILSSISLRTERVSAFNWGKFSYASLDENFIIRLVNLLTKS